MKTSTSLLLGMTLLATEGCRPGEGAAQGTRPATPAGQVASSNSAPSRREQALAALRQRLGDLDLRYKDLESRAAAAVGQEKADLQVTLAAAKAKRDAAARKLLELETATDERWQMIVAGAGHALDDLKKAFDSSFTP